MTLPNSRGASFRFSPAHQPAVLRIAEGRRGFDELSLARFAAWGAVTSLLLSGLDSDCTRMMDTSVSPEIR
jgi:hypothetical protein